jgi:hypothetical protein
MGKWRIAPPFLNSAPDRGEWSASRLYRFTPKEIIPGIHCKEGWASPRAGPDVMDEKKYLAPYCESNPDSSVIQFVAYLLHRLSCPGSTFSYTTLKIHINIMLPYTPGLRNSCGCQG